MPPLVHTCVSCVYCIVTTMPIRLLLLLVAYPLLIDLNILFDWIIFYHLSWSNISNPFKPCIPLQLRISALRCATVPRYLEAVSRMIVSPPGEALELAQGPARGGLNHELAQQNLEMLGLCALSFLSKIGYMYIPPKSLSNGLSSYIIIFRLKNIEHGIFPDISNICPYLEMLDEGCGVFEERLLQSLQSLQSTGNVCIWT